jgi:hypothetical protein
MVMHIDDMPEVQMLNEHRRKLMRCYSQFDRMLGTGYRLIADYEHAANDRTPWTEMPFIEITGSVARDLCSQQLTAVEARLKEMGVEVAKRQT